MSTPLRLMTLNTQLLPLASSVWAVTISIPGALRALFPNSDEDAKEKARMVANALLSIPSPQQPDVIGLNEVFSEDGRRVLIKMLTSVWPYVVESIEENDLEEDAGLMVFSRIPFRELPDGGYRRRLFYSVDADVDSWASKGAILVQVDQPTPETTLVFTHLQASYEQEDEYRDIRGRQLEQLVEWIDEFLEYDDMKWRNVILAGDLNIRGDGKATGEWLDIFGENTGYIADRLVDTFQRGGDIRIAIHFIP